MKSIFLNNFLINLNYVYHIKRWHCPAQIGTEGDEKGKQFPEHNELTIYLATPQGDSYHRFNFETEDQMDETLESIKSGMDCIDL